MSPGDVWDIIRVGMTLATVLIAVGVSAIVLNAIRPKKGKRGEAAAADPTENEELWRLVDVMEARLEVLERLLADQIEAPRGQPAERIERPRQSARERERDFLLAKDGRDTGRTE